MKFAKLIKDKNWASYNIFECNDYFNISMLAYFIIEDTYNSLEYLNWLNHVNSEDSIGGNNRFMIFENNIITIRSQDSYRDDLNEEERINEELCVFETTKEKMIDIFKQWISIVSEDPIKNKNYLPQNILFTLDTNNDVNITVIDDQDPRFSRLIKNNNPEPFLKLEKSNVFNDYIKAESNNIDLYEFGIFLIRYLSYKEEELNTKITDSQRQYLYYFSTCLIIENNFVYFNNKYNQETKEWELGYPIEKQNFIDIVNQWKQILMQDQFPNYVLIKQENNKLKLSQY